MKKHLALFLALTMLLGALSACGQSAAAPEETAAPETTEVPAPTQAPEESDDAAAQAELDAASQAILDTLAAAQAKFAPDEVVCTVDGEPVTWDMYFYLLSDELMTVIYYLGGLPEDYTMALTEDMTMGQYLTDSVLAKAKYYSLAHTEALERGVGLTEEQLAQIDDQIAHLVEQYGGEEALREAMAQSNLTPELLRTLYQRNEELSSLMENIYGVNGEKMTEEDVLNWAAQEGYIRVKHILYYIFDENGTEMDEAGKAEQRARAEATLEELRSIEDNDALAARFHELMNSDSGDVGGLIQFQDGYTFTSGTMYPVFEEAAFALEEYGLSEVVESQSGYHVILRLPLDTNAATMNQDSGTGAYMSLRRTAANELFSRNVAGWMEEAQVAWSDGFENLDLNALFGIESAGESETENAVESAAEGNAETSAQSETETGAESAAAE